MLTTLTLALLLGAPFWGADVSVQNRIESSSPSTGHDVLPLIEGLGVSWVRIRVWTTEDNLARGLELARRARDEGLSVLLNLHLSDAWADPGRQQTPSRWEGLSRSALCDSLRGYTHRVTTLFSGIGVDMVQLGNEVDQGFLWSHGRIRGQDWNGFAALWNAGVGGIRRTNPDLPVMVHVTTRVCFPYPCELDHTVTGAEGVVVEIPCTHPQENFIDRMRQAHLPFDAIGVSYYPWWHGDLGTLNEALMLIDDAPRYDVPRYIVETAYPWTLEWYDSENNIVGLEDQLLPHYPATPEGQRVYLDELRRLAAVRGVKGIFYWEPAWISKSPWENMGWLDQQGEPILNHLPR